MSTDTVAADRDRFTDYLWGFLAGEVVTPERIAAAMSGALRDGYIRDAAAVRHEHGERIAKAIAVLPGSNLHHGLVRRADAMRAARDLSPPPPNSGCLTGKGRAGCVPASGGPDRAPGQTNFNQGRSG